MKINVIYICSIIFSDYYFEFWADFIILYNISYVFMSYFSLKWIKQNTFLGHLFLDIICFMKINVIYNCSIIFFDYYFEFWADFIILYNISYVFMSYFSLKWIKQNTLLGHLFLDIIYFMKINVIYICSIIFVDYYFEFWADFIILYNIY